MLHVFAAEGELWVSGGYEADDENHHDVWHTTDGTLWSEATNSSRVRVPMKLLAWFWFMKLSTHSGSRFQTATGKPCSSTSSA